ncbi:MAG: succinylglutamate desuccinylase/aspartoacylase family protein [Chloroflexota bacterium]
MTQTPGKTLTTLPVCTLANGHRLELYVHEIHGAGEGPTLGLIGGVHGDEPLSIEIIRRIVSETDPAQVHGTLLAMPVANAYAIEALTRNTPLDMNNLNRVFPGEPDGMFTEQFASIICRQFLPRSDYFVDLHSGGMLATVDYVYIHDDSADLSRAFGGEILYRGPSYPGSLANYARQQGIPSVVSELGGGLQWDEHFVEKGVRGVRNIMKHLKMIDGHPELPPRQTIVNEIVILRPHQGGFMYSEVKLDQLGKPVPQGTVLGRILSPYTFEELEVVRAPFDPSILVLLREPITRVNPGDYGFMVANGATAAPA